MGENFYNLMNTMFNNSWTSGEELFLGAGECHHRARKWVQEESYFKDTEITLSFLPPTLSIDPTTLQASCAANLQLCAWNQTNNPRLKDGSEFEKGYGSYDRYIRSELLEFQGCQYA